MNYFQFFYSDIFLNIKTISHEFLEIVDFPPASAGG
jgi:hypothetical protein